MNPNALATNPNSLLTQAQSAKQALKVPTIAQGSGADFAERLRESKSRAAEKREPDPLTKPTRTRERTKSAKAKDATASEGAEADASDAKAKPAQRSTSAEQSATKPVASAEAPAAPATDFESVAPLRDQREPQSANLDEKSPELAAQQTPASDSPDQTPESEPPPAPAPPNIQTLLRPLTISDLNRLLVRADQRVSPAPNGPGPQAGKASGESLARSARSRSQASDQATADQPPATQDAAPAQADDSPKPARVPLDAQSIQNSNFVDAATSATSDSAPQPAPIDPLAKSQTPTSPSALAPSFRAPAQAQSPASPSASSAEPVDSASPSASQFASPINGNKAANPTSTKAPARLFDLTHATTSPARTESLDAQIGRGLSATLALKGGSVTLRLQPEALGQVRIHMKMDRSALGVRFEVGSSAARALLDEHLPALQRSLESQGFSLDKVSVHTDPALASTTKPDHPAHDAPIYNPPADAGAQFNAGTDARDEHTRNGGDRSFQGSAASEIAAAEITESVIHPSQGGVLDAITLRLNAVA
jgi:flagellar hook-length control protein FliK